MIDLHRFTYCMKNLISRILWASAFWILSGMVVICCWGPQIKNWYIICLKPSLPCLLDWFWIAEIQLPLRLPWDCDGQMRLWGSESRMKLAEDNTGKMSTQVWGMNLQPCFLLCFKLAHFTVTSALFQEKLHSFSCTLYPCRVNKIGTRWRFLIFVPREHWSSQSPISLKFVSFSFSFYEL